MKKLSAIALFTYASFSFAAESRSETYSMQERDFARDNFGIIKENRTLRDLIKKSYSNNIDTFRKEISNQALHCTINYLNGLDPLYGFYHTSKALDAVIKEVKQELATRTYITAAQVAKELKKQEKRADAQEKQKRRSSKVGPAV